MASITAKFARSLPVRFQVTVKPGVEESPYRTVHDCKAHTAVASLLACSTRTFFLLAAVPIFLELFAFFVGFEFSLNFLVPLPLQCHCHQNSRSWSEDRGILAAKGGWAKFRVIYVVPLVNGANGFLSEE
ncbi:hypothetical protein B0H14DRAFT_2574023 [Mycena olivaceomarginata]|nr:hypothetical protein B0H14DRAFT_2574023 [Mycena olivaceomarginata]